MSSRLDTSRFSAPRPDPFAIAAALLDADRCRWTPLPHQIPPDFNSGEWEFWLLCGGRGIGKTDAGAAALDGYMQAHAGVRGRIIAPTLGDAREACVIGPSGILAHNPSVHFNQNEGALYWPNGSRAKIFGAYTPEDVERLRAGGNSHIDWYEEFAAWAKLDEAWDQARFGLRLGPRPRTIITTTPRPRDRLKWLLGQVVRTISQPNPAVVLSRASTSDNPHLSPAVRSALYAAYENTALGAQELEGLLVDEVEGALWRRQQIEAVRILPALLPDFLRIVVAVDPPGGTAEAGIIVAGLGADRLGYILADYSRAGSPSAWATAAWQAFDDFQADMVVVEINFGGDMAVSTLKTARENGPTKTVRASRGKRVRAEPVAALYGDPARPETWGAGRVRHAGRFPLLEDQQCQWVPDSGQPSPDRMDGAVWALTDLMLGESEWVPQAPNVIAGQRSYG